jgi:7-cyano-7-deazaguanine synthase in queuosine biosynthesis
VKFIQLFSGGFDSVGQAILLLNEGHEVVAMYVKFRKGGGKQAKELKRAKWFAEQLRIPFVVWEHRIPKSEYSRRDHTLVEIAAKYARSTGAHRVAIATSYQPDVANPIANIDWEDMNPESLSKAAGMPVETLEKLKSELLDELWEDQREMLFETTSCQLWFKKECGRCYRCAERHAAFMVALGYDQTEYSHDPEQAKAWPEMLRQESMKERTR